MYRLVLNRPVWASEYRVTHATKRVTVCFLAGRLRHWVSRCRLLQLHRRCRRWKCWPPKASATAVLRKTHRRRKFVIRKTNDRETRSGGSVPVLSANRHLFLDCLCPDSDWVSRWWLCPVPLHLHQPIHSVSIFSVWFVFIHQQYNSNH